MPSHPLPQLFWAANPAVAATAAAAAAALTNLTADGSGLNATANKSARPQHRLQSALLYLVLACSLLSLVAFLAVYRSLSQLRNRAGFILCWHAASLLVVELLHLAGHAVPLPQPVCVTNLLASFMALTGTFSWAAVFGIDLLVSIGSRTVRPARETPLGYARLAALVWLPPALMTGALAGLHFRYGLLNNRRCDAASAKQWLMVGLSVVPLGCSLLINLAVLGALCATLLMRSRQAARSVGRRAAASQSRLAIVTLKVSVILGITWLPYFCIAKLLGRGREPVSSFAAEVIVDLHGCLLSACFCLNRKTRSRLAHLFARRRSSGRMSLQGSGGGVCGGKQMLLQQQHQHQHQEQPKYQHQHRQLQRQMRAATTAESERELVQLLERRNTSPSI